MASFEVISTFLWKNKDVLTDVSTAYLEIVFAKTFE